MGLKYYSSVLGSPYFKYWYCQLCLEIWMNMVTWPRKKFCLGCYRATDCISDQYEYLLGQKVWHFSVMYVFQTICGGLQSGESMILISCRQ